MLRAIVQDARRPGLSNLASRCTVGVAIPVFGNDRAAAAQAQRAMRAPASASTRSAIATTSDAGISRKQRWSFMVQTGRWQGWHVTTVLVCTVAARPFRGAQ